MNNIMKNFTDLNNQELTNISGGNKRDYKAGYALGRFTKYLFKFGMMIG